MDGRSNKALDRQSRNDYESVRFNGSRGTHVSDPTLDRIERPSILKEPTLLQEIRNHQAAVLRVELYRRLACYARSVGGRRNVSLMNWASTGAPLYGTSVVSTNHSFHCGSDYAS